VTTEARFVQALALGLDPAWRRLPEPDRCEDARSFAAAVERAPGVQTFTYSMVGLQAGADVLVWRLGVSLDALEEAAAAALRTGIGRWMTVKESLLGLIQGSQYVKKPTEQEQSLFSGERSRYLVVYPFTKGAEWYLMGREARQGVMNEHMRIGHDYPQVRQLLANSFGLDDMDFLVAYETDDLGAFSQLVRALRGSESRRSTVRDTPILTAVHRPLTEITILLGAPTEGSAIPPYPDPPPPGGREEC
jgi:chlorite dismutase